MKKSTFFLFILLNLSFTIIAQNWTPLNKNYYYNYKFDNANNITNSILVDSIELSLNGDSIFYLNRIMLGCDTCHALNTNNGFICDSCFELGNQPQFLQRKVIKYTNGVYNFRDTGNIVINSVANVGTTWLFDSVYNIQATIISITLDSIITVTDSIKTILLSSGDTIKFSKNYGIILYPFKYGLYKYHKLCGINPLQIGENAPTYKEIFDFNIGDKYYYSSFSYSITGNNTVTQNQIIKKKEILSKTTTNSDIIFSVKLMQGTITKVFDVFSSNTISITFNSNIDTINEYYDSSLDPIKHNAQQVGNGYNYRILKSVFTLDVNNIFTKMAGAVNSSPYSNYYEIIEPEVNQYNETVNGIYQNVTFNPPYILNYYYNTNAPFGNDYSYVIYKTGLGLVGKGDGFFEAATDEALVGYIKNGITYGTIYSDSQLLSAINIDDKSRISIYPNPATNLLNLNLESITSSIITIKTIEGNIIYSEKSTRQNIEHINTSNLSNGLYLLTVTSPTKTETLKFLIHK
jgi:hypothetical protein